MSDIIGSLPYTITNGTLANADEVQADFDFIVNQVNANAQPGGGGAANTISWTLMPTQATYLTATSFTMPGDQTASFTVGRRIKSTNTAGLVYSVVTSASVVLDTTITVTNQTGVLDTGMSDISIGTIDPAATSVPALTDMTIGRQGDDQTSIPTNTSTQVLVTLNAPPRGDSMNEWDRVNGRFYPTYDGDYLVSISADIYLNGADLGLASTTFQANVFKNNSQAELVIIQSWLSATGVSSDFVAMHGFASIALVAGDYIDLRIEGGNWTVADPKWRGVMSIRRMPYKGVL